MSGKIEAKEIAVGNLFSENFMFKIPLYQRPFSWTKDNFYQLFDDVSDSMDNSLEQYFLGSILLQQTGKNSYDLVDGQQRITALTILLAIIRDETSNKNLSDKIKSYIYQEQDVFKEIPEVMRITPWDELKDLFKDYIYQVGGTKRFIDDFDEKKLPDQDDPRYHIYEAIQTFNEKLISVNVENFVKYLLNKVYMVYIMTDSRASAFRLFSVLNSRGLALDASDLMKSENLGIIQDITTRNKYANIWRDIEEEIGREELSKVIAFIRTIKTKEKAQFGMYEEFQQIFKKNLLTKGTGFIDYLKKTVDIYSDKVLEAKLDSNDAREKNEYKIIIESMRDFIPFSDWIPPLLAFQLRFNSDSILLKFLSELEKKTVVEWTIGLSPTERITSLNRIIKLIDESVNPNIVIENIKLKRKEDFEKFIFKLNDSQLYSIYGGKLAKSLLLILDRELWELENFSGYPGAITVEHVLPQNPIPDSKWVKIFTEKDREEWTNKLGNLVLLSGRKNSKARNFEFDRKKEAYFGQKGTAFKITQQLENYSDWNLEVLKKRHDEFIKIAKDIYFC